MSKEENYKNIYQRIHAVMQKVDYVQKEKKGQAPYASVSHDAVTGKVRPALVEQNVIYFPQDMKYSQDGNRTEVTLNLHFVCIDKPDDRLIVPAFGYGVDNQDKGPGKAVSYAVKYALLKAFGLETGDDPDNDSVDHKPKEKKEEQTAEQKWLGDTAKKLKEMKTYEEVFAFTQSKPTMDMMKNLSTDQVSWYDAKLKEAQTRTMNSPIPNGASNGTAAHN